MRWARRSSLRKPLRSSHRACRPPLDPLRQGPEGRRSVQDGSRLLGDFIEDNTLELPLDSATTESLRAATHDVLAGLTAREAKVLRMRFGIDMNTDHTLEEVGKQFDVTRERIRQIEAKALRKLRHPSRSEVLRSFLDD